MRRPRFQPAWVPGCGAHHFISLSLRFVTCEGDSGTDQAEPPSGTVRSQLRHRCAQQTVSPFGGDRPFPLSHRCLGLHCHFYYKRSISPSCCIEIKAQYERPVLSPATLLCPHLPIFVLPYPVPKSPAAIAKHLKLEQRTAH